MPLSFGGNIKSIDDAKLVFDSGMEKVVLGSAAFSDQQLISLIANSFGSQAVSVCIDVLSIDGDCLIATTNGLEERHAVSLSNFLKSLEAAGVGEIIIQSVDRDSTQIGYDTEAIALFRGATGLPLVALGGCSSLNNFVDARDAGATAVAAGSIFTFVGPHRAVLINYPSDEVLEKLLH